MAYFIVEEKEDIHKMVFFIIEDTKYVDDMLEFIIKKTEKTVRCWISLPTKKKLSNMVFLWEVRIQRKEGSRKHLGFFLQLSEMVMSMNFSISSVLPLQSSKF